MIGVTLLGSTNSPARASRGLFEACTPQGSSPDDIFPWSYFKAYFRP